jgi:hypothetical protein
MAFKSFKGKSFLEHFSVKSNVVAMSEHEGPRGMASSGLLRMDQGKLDIGPT